MSNTLSLEQFDYLIKEHQYGGFITSEDSFNLDIDSFEKIKSICDKMVMLRNIRSEYLLKLNKNKAVFEPGNLWDDSFCANNFRLIAAKDYHTINHLRLLTHNFTGYRLIDMSFAEGKDNITEIPKNISDLSKKYATEIQNVIYDHLKFNLNIPENYKSKAPRLFGEIGWEFDGKVINYDIWSIQQRINALYHSGILDYLKKIISKKGTCRILEIGAGYGGLAYNLINMLEDVEYTIVDLPESLIYSSIYLSTLFPTMSHVIAEPEKTEKLDPNQITYISNYLLDDFDIPDGHFDLVINVLSLTEMAPEQVEYYAKTIQRLIGDDGIFFEQNYVVPLIHTNAPSILKTYLPYQKTLKETPAPHSGRGTVNIWANKYISDLFDLSVYNLPEQYISETQQKHKPLYSNSSALSPFIFDRIDQLNTYLKNEPVVIYGAGEHTTQLLENPKFKQLNIVAIADKDGRKLGKHLEGFEVVSPSTIPNYADHVIISTKAFESAVVNELKDAFKERLTLHTLYRV